MKKFLNVVILNLDGIPDRNGDFFDRTSKITCDRSDVPITDAIGTVVGLADLVFQHANASSQFKVDLKFFNEPTSAMLDLIPCFYGKCISRMSCHVLESKIMSVALHPQNADARIPSLRHYTGFATPKPTNDCKCERLLNGHELTCSWRKNGKN